VADPIKSTTAEAIEKLHQEGIKVVMLTGDSRTTAEAVGRKLGIDEVLAEVCRIRRRRWSRNFSHRERSLRWRVTASTMHLPSPRRHVGIAMGTGTDVAMQSAGVTLVKGDLRGSSGRGD